MTMIYYVIFSRLLFKVYHEVLTEVLLYYAGLFLGVAAKPTLPSWLWEPVPPSEGTCAHFRGNISQEGYVSSPKYPSNYPDSLTCEMIIYGKFRYHYELIN